MKIGLVLSGGGVRGIAHIGVIKALEEHGITISHIAGTSAGAVVGALYSAGTGWKEMLTFFESIQLFRLSKYASKKPGIVDPEKFYNQFLDYFPKDDFSILKKKLFITATNILDGTLEIFHDGPLIRPILASSAFPGLFAPIKINEEYYVDGGVLNNFPSDLITLHCDYMIGVYVNPFKKVEIEELKHYYTILDRAFKIIMAKESFAKFEDCNLIICPEDLNNYSTFVMKDMNTIFNLGYDSAKEALKNTDFSKTTVDCQSEFKPVRQFSV